MNVMFFILWQYVNYLILMIKVTLDLGIGGGFPGIPLAIMFPNVNFVLLILLERKPVY